VNFTIRDSSGADSTTPITTKLMTRMTAQGCHARSSVRTGCADVSASVPT
jgi:hypothetical protein